MNADTSLPSAGGRTLRRVDYTRRNATPRRWLGVAAVLAVLVLSVLGPWMTYKPQPFTGEGSPARQLGYVLAFLAALAALRPLAKPERLLIVPLWLALALGWCWLSLAWSISPEIALRRLLLTTMFVWTVFASVDQAGYSTTVKLMRLVMVATLFANYCAVLLAPEFGIHQFGEPEDPGLIGDWRGVMLQKNFAGAMCAFTIIAFLFDARRVHVAGRILVIAAATYFLVRTGSKTSLGLVGISIVLGGLFVRYNPAYRALLIPAVMLLTVGVSLAAIAYWHELASLFDSPAAFTGRVQIWPVLLAYANDHPLGAGYGSFWNIGKDIGPIFTYGKGWITGMTQGHNGYLDMLVAVGLPGLILIVFAVLIMPVFQILSSRSVPRGPGALLLAMVIFCAGHNLTESSLFERDMLVQAFLMLALAMIGQVTAAPRAGSVRA